MVERQKVTRELPCKLSKKEVEEQTTALVAETIEFERCKLELREMARQLSEKRRSLQKSILERAQMVTEKAQVREVECEVVKDFARGEIRVTRLDTLEELEKLNMSQEEGQRSFG